MVSKPSRKSIFFTGVKHSGKTTIAERIAWEMKAKHFDLDDLIEREYRNDRLLSCREIYKQHGKEYFLEIEATAAVRLVEYAKDALVVGSLGGGTIENEHAMRVLDPAGLFVYLEHDPDVLFRRIMKSGIPPFLSEENPYQSFIEIVTRRAPLLKRRADIVVHLVDGPVDKSVAEVGTCLREYGYAW